MNPPHIDDFRFGKIIVDGKTFTKDLIITPSGVIPDWWRKSGHSLSIDDLSDINLSPDMVLIIGTGMFDRMVVSSKTRTYLESVYYQTLIQATNFACQTYNQRSKGELVVAALHLTC